MFEFANLHYECDGSKPILQVNVPRSYSLSMIGIFLIQKEHVQRDGDTWTGMFMFNFEWLHVEFFLILRKLSLGWISLKRERHLAQILPVMFCSVMKDGGFPLLGFYL